MLAPEHARQVHCMKNFAIPCFTLVQPALMALRTPTCSPQVRGKVNAITIDQCVRTGVVFEDLVAVCELVNSSALQVQVTGRVPTIAIDKCDGVQVRPDPGSRHSQERMVSYVRVHMLLVVTVWRLHGMAAVLASSIATCCGHHSQDHMSNILEKTIVYTA